MDLFDYMREKTQEQESPLASRMRPQTLEEVVGQQHIIGKDKLLYRAIKADKLGSIVFLRYIPSSSFASFTTCSISFFPATVALICLNSALVVCAITFARVVFPVPGGP